MPSLNALKAFESASRLMSFQRAVRREGVGGDGADVVRVGHADRVPIRVLGRIAPRVRAPLGSSLADPVDAAGRGQRRG